MKQKTFLVGILSVIILVIVLFANCSNPRKTDTQPTTIDTVQVDTIEQPAITPEQAAKDMIDFQKETIEFYTLDSVFRSLPIEIIGLIVQHNPDYTSYDVAHEYMKNKCVYDAWLNDYRKVSKLKTQSNPDTIPDKAKNDIPITKL